MMGRSLFRGLTFANAEWSIFISADFHADAHLGEREASNIVFRSDARRRLAACLCEESVSNALTGAVGHHVVVVMTHGADDLPAVVPACRHVCE